MPGPTRDRWFESPLVQRRVSSELGAAVSILAAVPGCERGASKLLCLHRGLRVELSRSGSAHQDCRLRPGPETIPSIRAS
jgi:hypothetical protein